MALLATAMLFNDLRELVLNQIKDLYDAEHRIVEALPEMVKKASSPLLRQAFNAHLAETHGHIAILESVIIDSDDDPPTKSTSADPDAAWTKKGKSFLYGYKEHTAVDTEGFIEHVHITPANVHDGKELETIVNHLPEHTTEVAADKGYASKDNSEFLESQKIKDSIMSKAARNKPLLEIQLKRNKAISAFRFRVEQTFGIKKLHFDFHRTSYRGLKRVAGQSFLKAICVNLLKALRKLRFTQPLAA